MHFADFLSSYSMIREMKVNQMFDRGTFLALHLISLDALNMAWIDGEIETISYQQAFDKLTKLVKETIQQKRKGEKNMRLLIPNCTVLKKVVKEGKNAPFYRVFVDTEDSIDEMSITEDAYKVVETGKPLSLICDYRTYNGSGSLRVVGMGK